MAIRSAQPEIEDLRMENDLTNVFDHQRAESLSHQLPFQNRCIDYVSSAKAAYVHQREGHKLRQAVDEI